MIKFNSLSQRTRERILGLLIIICTALLVAPVAMSCTPEYVCTAVSGTTYSRRAVAQHIKKQDNYKLGARNHVRNP